MAICPKCKMEYVDGMTTCPDCRVPLVEKAEEILKELYMGTERMATRLVDYLQYAKIDSAVLGDTEIVENPEVEGEMLEVFRVLVSEQQWKEAERLAKVFVYNETVDQLEQKAAQEAGTEAAAEGMEQQQKTGQAKKYYVKKADQYEDFSSSAVTFLVVGVAGMIFLLLNSLGVFHIGTGSGRYLANIVMGAMFLVFIVVGVSSLRTARKIRDEIKPEEEQTAETLRWFLETYTKENVDANCGIDCDAADELNYFARSEYMKEQLWERLKDRNPEESYLEALTEELYQKLYEPLP